jgi:WhiB family transcriptional regulator, redox-sensing transcriptional regulator
MTRRERVLAHLAEYPGLSTHEIARALGGGRGGDYHRLLTDMQRKGQLLLTRQPRPNRGLVQVWLVAPPGTRPKFIADPDRENKRRRDRDYQRRHRARARGETPVLATERVTARRLALPVAALDLGDWRTRAGCLTADPDLFFSSDPADIAQARQVCAGCPVMRQCHARAEANKEEFGVWAGIDRDLRHAEQIAS